MGKGRDRRKRQKRVRENHETQQQAGLKPRYQGLTLTREDFVKTVRSVFGDDALPVEE